MKDDTISRLAAIEAFKKELTTGEQKGKYVTICSAVSFEGAKKILEALPAVDAVNKNKLVETIKHCMQYPDGINRLLAIYEGERNDRC